jgi:AraC-like DNA-binding protein
MTLGPDLRIATLNDARSRRSAEKRAAVEDAIMRLRETRQAVTFVSVAREAKVSRQYLYNNFADEIGEERAEIRAETQVIDGKKVPLRTPEEHRHIEAALRNKIERLETEIRDARAEKAKADRTAERERGKAEHWRQLYTAVLARVSGEQGPEKLPSPED